MSSNKVILVTGSNTGIGYELVHLLAAKGYTVYLAARKEAAGLEAVAKIKKEKNLDVNFVRLDVTDIASVNAAAAKIEKDEGRLNVLVNNAGIAEMSTPQSASSPSLAAIRATFESNVIGTIQTTTALLPLLRPTWRGPTASRCTPRSRIIAAANSWSIALARELKEEAEKGKGNVKVNSLTPGFTTTALNGFAPGGKTAEEGARMMVPWCLLDKDGETGKFICDSGEFPW
ncbi:hypothetical protein C8R43DRAFT_1107667 [Mycena crocata]|nr:hypothetical protein C8R43DRAFT_1107667 [Mycena crocata]